MATATYIPIATQTLSSAAASITFSSIPGTYTDLRLVLTCTTTAGANIFLQFNGDTATNYSATYLYGGGTSAGSSYDVSVAQIYLTDASSTNTTVPSIRTVDIMSYAGSTSKAMLKTESGDYNGSGTVAVAIGLWRSTAAITSMLITASGTTFATGTIATLWGI